MKALVVYDSVFGNTEQIARAMGAALGSPEEAPVLRVTEVKPEQLAGLELLLVGSPTRAFKATPGTTNLLRSIPAGALKGVRVAGFDTRVSLEEVGSRVLTFMVKLFGYDAEPISRRLQKKGGVVAVAPEGFIVQGSEGPLRDGELERAAAWARRASGAGG